VKILSWLIGLPVAMAVILFALSNRQAVDVGLWPFAEILAVPVYAAVLGPLALGLLIGLFYGGLGGLRARAAARAASRRADGLARELDALRAESAAPPPSVPEVSHSS